MRFDRALHQLIEFHDGVEVVTFDMALNEENMSEDGFHPGPVVYARWADRVAERIPPPG